MNPKCPYCGNADQKKMRLWANGEMLCQVCNTDFKTEAISATQRLVSLGLWLASVQVGGTAYKADEYAKNYREYVALETEWQKLKQKGPAA